MSNQAQQSSTICSIVRQCCEDESSFNDLSSQIVMFVTSNQTKEIKPIIDTIKKVIKDKKSDSPSKVQALKLLNQCLMQSNNEEFLMYMEKKILSRLAIFARYKKESTDLEKGIHLFGKTFNNKASSDFLKLLLLYLQKWGSMYTAYPSNGRQTELNKVYLTLQKERIHFPSEEAVMQSLSHHYLISQALDTTLNDHKSPISTAKSLNQSMVGASNFNRGQFNTNQSSQSQFFQDRPSSQALQSSRQLDGSMISQHPQDQSLSMNEQIRLGNKIKADYKRLNEYQNQAKLVQEVLGMSGNIRELDGELLMQFRSELTEGKEFAEGFLTMLMDTGLKIKDKESKIEKILSIINEIETQLNKILAVKPYSPRALSAMQAKKQQQQDTIQAPQEKRMIPRDSVPVQYKSTHPLDHSRKEEAKYTPDTNMLKSMSRSTNPLTKSVQEFKPQQEPQVSNFSDFNFDKNAFKTNFAQDPSWNTFNQSQSQSNFMDFNSFNPPSGNNFEFNNSSAPSEFKWEAPKQQEQPVMLQPKVLPQPQQPYHPLQKQEETKLPETKVTKKAPMKVGQLPSLPGVQSSKMMKNLADEPIQQQEGHNDSSSNEKEQPRFEYADQRQKSEGKFGVVKKIENHKPQITSQTPGSDPESCDEGQGLEVNEKAKFNFPQSNEKLRMSMALKSDEKPSWDFNFSNGKQQHQQDAFAFNNSAQQQHQPVPHNQAQQPDFAFPQQNNAFTFNNPPGQNPFQQDANERFDFTEQPVDTMSFQPQVEALSHELTNLHGQYDEQRQQLRIAQDKTREVEQRLQSSDIRIRQLEHELNQLDKECGVLEEERDQREREVKQLRKYEILYEEEKYSNSELKKANDLLKQQVEEYKRMADRLEHKVNKTEKELDSTMEHMKAYEAKIIEMRVQHEQDLKDAMMSEGQIKKQMQTEIFESRKKEEEVRQQMHKDKEEGKKRESYMKEQWVREVEEAIEKEHELQRKIDELEAQLKERDQEIEQVRKQKEQEENSTPRLKLRSHQIKFVSENSEKLSVPKPVQQNLINQFDSTQVVHKKKSSKELQGNGNMHLQMSNGTPPLFSSFIKPAQDPSIHNLITVNNFEPEQTQEVQKYDDIDLEEMLAHAPSSDSDTNSDQHDHVFNPSTFKKEQSPNSVFIDDDLRNPEPHISSIPRNQEILEVDVEDMSEVQPKRKQSSPLDQQPLIKAPTPKNDFDFQTFGDQAQPKVGNDFFDFFNKPAEQPQQDFFNVPPQQQQIIQQEKMKTESPRSLQPTPVLVQVKTDSQKQEEVLGSVQQQPTFTEESKEDSEIYRSFEKDMDSERKNSSRVQEPVDLKPEEHKIAIDESPKEILNLNQKLFSETKLPLSDDKQETKGFDFMQLEELKSNDSNSNSPQNQPAQQVRQEVTPPKAEAFKPVLQSAPEITPPKIEAPRVFSSASPNNDSDPFAALFDNPKPQQQQYHTAIQQQPILPITMPLIQSQKYVDTPITTPMNQSSQKPDNFHMAQAPFNQQFQTHQPTTQQLLQQPNQEAPKLNTSEVKTQQDVTFDKSQYNTSNTEALIKQQQMQQQQQSKMNPQVLMQHMLLQFFRKSLLSNKSVLYEDQNIQIGMLADYQPTLVRMRLFFGNKNQPSVQQISLTQIQKPFGFQVNQNKEAITQLVQGQQDVIDINMKIEGYQLSIPLFGLSYKVNNQLAQFPIRLPLILLKLCQAIPNLDTPQAYIFKWQFECDTKSEAKQSFNIDFQQCRSLTQLKETLKFGNNAFAFVDGVDEQKNVVCGGTQYNGIQALVKIMVTGNGQNCEITARSSDVDDSSPGKFGKFVIGNILEMIALKVNPH